MDKGTCWFPAILHKINSLKHGFFRYVLYTFQNVCSPMSVYIYFKREFLLRVWVDFKIWGVNALSLIYTLPQKKCNLNLSIFPPDSTFVTLTKDHFNSVKFLLGKSIMWDMILSLILAWKWNFIHLSKPKSNFILLSGKIIRDGPLMILGGGLGQRIRVEFFFLANLLIFFFLGNCKVTPLGTFK